MIKGCISPKKSATDSFLKSEADAESLFNGHQNREELNREKCISWVRWRVSKTYKEYLHDCDVMAILTDISCVRIMLFYKSVAEDSFAY